MAPEGTRKNVPVWKTGFYYIAKQAGVPFIPVIFNYKTKTVTTEKPIYVTDEAVNDIKNSCTKMQKER